MATGTATFLWYFLCCGFLMVISLVAMGLIAYGERQKKKRRAQNLLTAQAAADDVADEAAEPRVDPDAPGR